MKNSRDSDLKRNNISKMGRNMSNAAASMSQNIVGHTESVDSEDFLNSETRAFFGGMGNPRDGANLIKQT